MYQPIMYLQSSDYEYELHLHKDGVKFVLFMIWRRNGDIFIKERKDMKKTYDTLEEAMNRFKIGSELIAKGEGNFNYKSEKIFGNIC